MYLILVNSDLMRHISLLSQRILDATTSLFINQTIFRTQPNGQRLPER